MTVIFRASATSAARPPNALRRDRAIPFPSFRYGPHTIHRHRDALCDGHIDRFIFGIEQMLLRIGKRLQKRPCYP